MLSLCKPNPPWPPCCADCCSTLCCIPAGAGKMKSLPSVRTPSTSKRRSLIFFARVFADWALGIGDFSIWRRQRRELARLLRGDCSLQVTGRFVDACCDVFDYLRDHGNLSVGLLPLFFVHVFPDGGDGFCAVSGIGAWGVDLILEPGTLGQAFFVEKQARDSEQIGIHCVQRLRRNRRIAALELFQRLRVTIRALFK